MICYYCSNGYPCEIVHFAENDYLKFQMVECAPKLTRNPNVTTRVTPQRLLNLFCVHTNRHALQHTCCGLQDFTETVSVLSCGECGHVYLRKFEHPARKPLTCYDCLETLYPESVIEGLRVAPDYTLFEPVKADADLLFELGIADLF